MFLPLFIVHYMDNTIITSAKNSKRTSRLVMASGMVRPSVQELFTFLTYQWEIDHTPWLLSPPFFGCMPFFTQLNTFVNDLVCDMSRDFLGLHEIRWLAGEIFRIWGRKLEHFLFVDSIGCILVPLALVAKCCLSSFCEEEVLELTLGQRDFGWS